MQIATTQRLTVRVSEHAPLWNPGLGEEQWLPVLQGMDTAAATQFIMVIAQEAAAQETAVSQARRRRRRRA